MDGYELITRIGEGGMGVVHLARRPGGPRVALKVLRPQYLGDDRQRERLAREVNSLMRIRSPRVAEIVDADPWGEVAYVATRYVPGLTLHDQVADEGPITDLRHFARGLVEALAAVHAVGVLHRDIKPSNVLMEGRNPVLIDFGLARLADDPKLTHTGWLLGTPGYLPPEVLHGDEATPATDIHSLGATIAFAGMGRPPFGRGPGVAIMDRVRRGEHDLSTLDPDLAPLIRACLAPDPHDRPTLPELRAALGAEAPAPRPADLGSTQPVSLLRRPDEETTNRVDDGWLEPWVHPQVPAPTTVQQAWVGQPLPAPEQEEKVGVGVRVRRAALQSGLILTAAGLVMSWPFPTVALLVVAAWLLRSGAAAAYAHGNRRSLRGHRWYDGAQAVLSSPWHLLASVPGSLGLALWSAGMAAAAVLVAYALNWPGGAALGFAGAIFALSLQLGPGSDGVSRPVRRAFTRVSRYVGPWLVVLAALLAIGTTAYLTGTTTWTPFHAAPWGYLGR